MAEYQDINLLFCNKNKLEVERNQYKRHSVKQLVFYRERIFQIQKLLHRLFLLKSTEEKDKTEQTDYEIEELEYILPDTLQDIYGTFLAETIDYFSFQDQSDELQEDIQCQIQKSKMNKLRKKLNTVDVVFDTSSDEFDEEPHTVDDVTKEMSTDNIGGEHKDENENSSTPSDQSKDNTGSTSITLNPLTNALIVKKKSINNGAFVKQSTLHKKNAFDPFSSKLKKKRVVYGKKYK
jgi:hypothetical protein